MQHLFTWAQAIAVAAILGLAWQLDAGADHGGEFAQADEIEAAARAQEREARRLAAGQALCQQSGGPNAAAVWLVDGSLECKTKRGRTFATHAGEAL